MTSKWPLAPGLASWLADIRQLEVEFGDIEVKWKETVVRVVTDPIVLRNVELGPFAIDLHWDRIGSAKGAQRRPRANRTSSDAGFECPGGRRLLPAGPAANGR